MGKINYKIKQRLLLLFVLLLGVNTPCWGTSRCLKAMKKVYAKRFSAIARAKKKGICLHHFTRTRTPLARLNLQKNAFSSALCPRRKHKPSHLLGSAQPAIPSAHDPYLSYAAKLVALPTPSLLSTPAIPKSRPRASFEVATAYGQKRYSGHTYDHYRHPGAYGLLLGSALGISLALSKKSNTVQARGYDDGYLSIYAFEDTMEALEAYQLSSMDEGELKILYESSTYLLFNIQEKVIQCKAIALATGYPLCNDDWQRYKRVRNRAERFVQRLCDQSSSLGPIGNMQELENAFFEVKGGDNVGECLEAFFKGTGQGILDAPGNLAKGTLSLVKLPFNVLFEVVDEALGSGELRRMISNYERKVKAFEKNYKNSGTSGTNDELTPYVINLVLASYDILFHIGVYKVNPYLKDELFDEVSRIRNPFYDEFCLNHTRKWAHERFADNFARMTPAQQIELASYMLANFVVDALLLDFVSDIAGLGELETLGQNSTIGRWISKTRGGRKTFKKLKKVHKRLRRLHSKHFKKGARGARVSLVENHLDLHRRIKSTLVSPEGKFIGHRGTSSGIRELHHNEAEKLVNQWIKLGAKEQPKPSYPNGRWFVFPDGKGFGLRVSEGAKGTGDLLKTIDIVNLEVESLCKIKIEGSLGNFPEDFPSGRAMGLSERMLLASYMGWQGKKNDDTSNA